MLPGVLCAEDVGAKRLVRAGARGGALRPMLFVGCDPGDDDFEAVLAWVRDAGVPATGGPVTRLFASDATMNVFNGLVFDGPASVALAMLDSNKYVLVTDFGLITLLVMKTPRTSLLSYGPLQ